MSELQSSLTCRRGGVCYERGTGVTKSRRKALEWWRKAAKAGSKRAADTLKKIRKKR